MNILHIEDEPWDSGIAHYALTLAAAQAAHDHRIQFWGARGSPVLAAARALGLIARECRTGPSLWLGISTLRRAAADFSPDVVNAHTGSAHVLALAVAPTRSAVVRTRADARLPTAHLLARWSARRTHMFIAANSATMDSLRRGFPYAAVRLVRQGIEGPPAPQPLPEDPILGMIARLDPVKGHDVVLAAARRLRAKFPDVRVRLAGSGRLSAALRRRLRDDDLAASVQMLGHVPDKWTFLFGCRIGIVASTGSEAVCRAALEWMSAGRPLVATRVGGISDLIEDGVTGHLVRPGRDEELSSAVESLLLDPIRAAEMGRRARDRWSRHFSPDPFYKTTQDAYETATHSVSR